MIIIVIVSIGALKSCTKVVVVVVVVVEPKRHTTTNEQTSELASAKKMKTTSCAHFTQYYFSESKSLSKAKCEIARKNPNHASTNQPSDRTPPPPPPPPPPRAPR